VAVNVEPPAENTPMLAVRASSAQCERVFSIAGLVLQAKRSNLATNKESFSPVHAAAADATLSARRRRRPWRNAAADPSYRGVGV